MPATTTANTPVVDDFDFSGYEDEVEESGSLPFAQLITPKDEDLPHGIFIKTENAEAVNFRPSAEWRQHNAKFGSGDSRVEEPGFIATHVRMAIVRRSSIKVFENVEYPETGTNARWRYLGEAYEAGQLTEAGQAAMDDYQRYQRRTMHLVYFLDEANNLLHDIPLQFTTKGAFGGSFGGEARLFSQEISRCFIKAARRANPKFKAGKLSDRILSCAVMDFEIGLRQSKSGSLVCYLSARHMPSVDNPGGTKNEKRKGDYAINLHKVDWKTCFLSKTSSVAKTLIDTYDSYETFGEVREREKSETESDLPQMESVILEGWLNLSTVQYMDNGDVTFKIGDRDCLVPSISPLFNSIADLEENVYGHATGVLYGGWVTLNSFNTQTAVDHNNTATLNTEEIPF